MQDIFIKFKMQKSLILFFLLSSSILGITYKVIDSSNTAEMKMVKEGNTDISFN